MAYKIRTSGSADVLFANIYSANPRILNPPTHKEQNAFSTSPIICGNVDLIN